MQPALPTSRRLPAPFKRHSGSAQPLRMTTRSTAADWIGANLEGGPVVKEKFVGGSNWSSAYVYTTQQGQEYFVKLAMGGRDDSMFQGEAQGLQAMYGEWAGVCVRPHKSALEAYTAC
jgi:hypothetical protein